ncbi:MAG TPA: nitroreductase family protein [Methanotrichaceae archaeon]|nr:nitroreductase family protein [Methanotrichaceae archaeon]
MTLAAVAEGLVCCWTGALYQQEVKEMPRIPEGIQVVALLSLGYPQERPSHASRKELHEIVSHEMWGQD